MKRDAISTHFLNTTTPRTFASTTAIFKLHLHLDASNQSNAGLRLHLTSTSVLLWQSHEAVVQKHTDGVKKKKTLPVSSSYTLSPLASFNQRNERDGYL